MSTTPQRAYPKPQPANYLANAWEEPFLLLNQIQSPIYCGTSLLCYRKIELCIVRMGDNDMRTACTLEQEMVDHVILELHIKEASCYN